MGKTSDEYITMNDPRLRRLRRISIVPRWAGVPTIRKQFVDGHSFHVSWIALWLVSRLEINKAIIANLLIYCLMHDEAEAVSGDIPAPAKKVIGTALKEFEQSRDFIVPSDHLVRIIAKMADCLEALMFCFEEQEMGNKSLDSIIADISDKLRVVCSEYNGLLPAFEVYGVDLEEELWEIIHPQRHPVLDEINLPVLDPDGDIPF